jgi:hypothetical protein
VSVTDYPDYQTPQAHADTISNTGVPLLSRPAVLVNQAGAVNSNLAVIVLNKGVVSKIGYEISLTLYAAVTNQCLVTVTIAWIDSVSGQTVVQEEWDMYAGSGAVGAANVIRGTGPTKGDRLTIQIQQNQPAIPVNYIIVVTENSRIYQRDTWRTWLPFSVTGFTFIENSDPSNLVLGGNTYAAVAANGSVTRLLPFSSGDIALSFQSTSAAADCIAIIHAVSSMAGGLTMDNVYSGKTDSSGKLYVPKIALPRAQCTLQLVNQNAAAKDLIAFVTVAEP